MNALYVTGVNFYGILIHTLLYMCLTYTIMILSKKIEMSFIIVNVCEWLFGVISVLKIEMRGQEFVPWDLSLTNSLFELSGFVQLTSEVIIDIIIQTFFIIAITITQIYVFKEFCELPKKAGKVFLLILSSVVLILFPLKYKMVDMKYIVPEKKGFENFGPHRGINRFGAFFNFILELGITQVNENVNYSDEKVVELSDKYETYDIQCGQEYDNVIFILLESFVDFEKILNEDLDEDVLANYHKYSKKYTNNKMNVDVIGGGTANVEYQVMTMHSMDNYPEGIFPYMHYIKENMDALPMVFKKNGYNTTAIHTYKEGFYNRESVFGLIGFDKYISDDDFENPDFYGEYIDDMEIYNEIVKLIEKEDKSFIHAITMGTHSPYYKYSWYDGEDILLEEEFGEYYAAINNYLYCLQRTDEMLGKLIEYVENSEEKTLLIVYGDHFPLFNGILDDLGIISESDKCIDTEKYPELYETPYMVVSNVKEACIENRGSIEPNELGMYVLENVELKKLPWIYKVFYNYFEGKELKENYEIIQYDQLHGEKFWKEV